MKKTICLVFDDLKVGGVLTLASETSKILLHLGYEVHILCGRNTKNDFSNYFIHIKPENFHTYRLSGGNRFIGYLEIVFLTWLHIFLIFRNRIDGFHGFMPFSYLGVLLNPLTCRTKKIYHFCGARDLELISVHKYSNESLQLKMKLSVKLRASLLFFVQKICMLNAKKIVAISVYSRTIIEKHFNINIQKISVIYCSVDINFFYYRSINLKEIMGLNRNTFLLLMIQRYDPRKGFRTFLKSLSLLKKSGQNFFAIIAGPPNWYMHSLMFYGKELGVQYNVMYLPEVSRRQLAELYSGADLLIISSIDLETFGQTIIEAFACKCPVVGTKIGAIPEILRQVKSYNLLVNADEISLAQRIKKYIHSSDFIKQQIKKEVLSVVNSKFTEAKITQDYKDLYKDFLL